MKVQDLLLQSRRKDIVGKSHSMPKALTYFRLLQTAILIDSADTLLVTCAICNEFLDGWAIKKERNIGDEREGDALSSILRRAWSCSIS